MEHDAIYNSNSNTEPRDNNSNGNITGHFRDNRRMEGFGGQFCAENLTIHFQRLPSASAFKLEGLELRLGGQMLSFQHV